MLGVRREDGDDVVRGEALLLDGRTATMVAWSEEGGEVVVALRVGHFGDRDQERAFLGRLAGVLRGKPGRRQRQDEMKPSTHRVGFYRDDE